MMENYISLFKNPISISGTYPVKLFDVDIFQSFPVFSFLELGKVGLQLGQVRADVQINGEVVSL